MEDSTQSAVLSELSHHVHLDIVEETLNCTMNCIAESQLKLQS